MEETTLTERWLNAARIASIDPKALIMCPANCDSPLAIFDVVVSESALSRYLVCPKCHARNVLEIRDRLNAGASFLQISTKDSEADKLTVLELAAMAVREREKVTQE